MDSNFIKKPRLNVLFVCTMNKWRSLTSEIIYKDYSELNVRSAGTSSRARKSINLNDIRWSDIIFFMENKHRDQVLKRFGNELRQSEIYILGIEDKLGLMDPELIEEIRSLVDPIIGLNI